MGNIPDVKHKVAILTFHRALNCGAVLQAWALQVILRQFGVAPEFPDCNRVGCYALFGKVWYRKKISGSLLTKILHDFHAMVLEFRKHIRYRRFLKRHLPVKNIRLCDFESRYRGVIVGSDQVWNDRITKDEDAYFLLKGFEDSNLKKYTYAISVGDEVPSPDRLTKLCLASHKFENLSIRESILLDLKDASERSPTIDLDPALLLKKSDYEPVAYPQKLEEQPYLLVYSLVHIPDILRKVCDVAKLLKLKLVVIYAYQYGRCETTLDGKILVDVSPDRFLAYIRGAVAVITSTFHGAVFSLVYEKPFVVLPGYNGKIPVRIKELLHGIHAENRIIVDTFDVALVAQSLELPLEKELFERLTYKREVSLKRIRDLISSIL